MPEQGKKQMPAGVDKSPKFINVGKRTMVSRNMMLKSNLSIDNVPYKGNATLNAND
tara:strand:+ start:181 stop:348 length:168 start_codon:yes stop_codon:yes gene_type:complete